MGAADEDLLRALQEAAGDATGATDEAAFREALARFSEIAAGVGPDSALGPFAGRARALVERARAAGLEGGREHVRELFAAAYSEMWRGTSPPGRFLPSGG